MLRKEDRPLFVALLAIAIAIIFTWLVPSRNYEREDKRAICTTHECREDAATETVAEYTELLAWFTAVLAFVSMAQGYFLLRADRTARNSIDLARDEFTATHRPRIYVQNVAVIDKGAKILQGGQTHRTPAKAIITIANGGEAPAFILEWRAAIYFQRDDAAFTPPLDIAPVQRPEAGAPGISPGEFQKIGHTQNHAVDDDWDEFVQEGGKMFFIGRVTYQGIDEIRRNTGFCRQYDPKDAGAWRAVKESEYEYTY